MSLVTCQPGAETRGRETGWWPALRRLLLVAGCFALLGSVNSAAADGAAAPAVVMAEKDRQLAQRLLDETRAEPSIAQRLKIISARLLGAAYLAHPLSGAPDQPEKLVARLDGFDCVTYLETALALAGARDLDHYLERLRALRYRDGEVAWAKRLHYASDWCRLHAQQALLSDLTRGAGTVERRKVLDFVPGFAPRETQLRFFPKRELERLKSRLADGDLIFFVSGRQALDANHAGLIFRAGDKVRLRHASRKHGKAVEQELDEFVGANLMIGFIIVRPLR